jgi:predicted GNAT family acetyltransferase
VVGLPDRDKNSAMELRAHDGYGLTTDPAQVDLDRVHTWLSTETYWARGRERDVVARSIEGSRPYSVHRDGEQCAFARTVTDGATFAWICDVFVDSAHRGRGLGTWMIGCMADDLAAEGVHRIVLATVDAHEVYRRCGFEELEAAHRWMEIDRRPTRRTVLEMASRSPRSQ